MMTDYTDIDEIPEWAKQMACDKANARADCVLWVPREIGAGFGVLDALALMCWQYCDEPVDPDLLIAREAMAQLCEQTSDPKVAAGYRNGDWDALLKDTPAYIAARLAREQGAK
jgi:hypothetical protein